MAKEWRQNAHYNEILKDGEEQEEQQPKASAFATRLPFGLCKKYGIPIQEWWTPRDAWNALKGKGITHQQIWADIKAQSGENGQEQGEQTAQEQPNEIDTRDKAVECLKTKLKMTVTPSISALSDNVIITQTKRLEELDSKFGVIAGTAGLKFAAQDKGSATAYVSTTVGSRKADTLSLCPSHFNDPNTINVQRTSRDSGYSMDCADEYLETYSLTHEYGHLVCHSILRGRNAKEMYDKNFQEAWAKKTQYGYPSMSQIRKMQLKAHYDCAGVLRKEIEAIAKKIEPKTKVKNLISAYGTTNHDEWFAEVFANSQCGKPNLLGKAMNIFLEKELGVKQ